MSVKAGEAMFKSPRDLVEYARAHSPYYKKIYAGLAEKDWKWNDVPLVDQSQFWAAQDIHNNQVLTAKQGDGIVFKSGGTTGAPKFSAFAQQEWEAFTTHFGWGLQQGGLADGSRVANVFYAGGLYASFLFIMRSLENSGIKVTHYPLTGAVDLSAIAECIEEFSIDVLAGLPTTLLAFEKWVVENKAHGRVKSLRTLLFGGESFYKEQRTSLLRTFSNVKVQSIGYASVDAGLLGYVTPDCGEDEHLPFEKGTFLEIIDDATGLPIEECGKPGRVVITNLTRKLMPIIRYPAGDIAEWTRYDKSEKRFRLLGRSEEGARIGAVTLYFDDARGVLSKFVGCETFQILVEHHSKKDALVIAIQSASQHAPTGVDSKKILEGLYEARPMLREFVEKGFLHTPEVRWLEKLMTNTRTGKLRRIVDLRKAGTT